MKRRLSQFLVALGLLLTFAAGALWMRGFWSSDDLVLDRSVDDGHVRFFERVSFWSTRYRLRVDWGKSFRSRIGPNPGEKAHPWRLEFNSMLPPTEPPDESLGFAFDFGKWPGTAPNGPNYFLNAMIPTWFVCVGSAALTVLALAFHRHTMLGRARSARGLCYACGYDLRGAAHERCPECGVDVGVAPHPV